jgi:uncharacterized protein (TIGR02145 family)
VKHLYLFGLLLSLPFFGFSQGEWNNWYFGADAAMTFNFGDPVALSGSALIQSAGGTATSISDSLGNTLFYSNGRKVWNKNNLVMPNGNGIWGGNTCQQPVFTVPKIGDSTRYYLFTVGEPEVTNPPLIGLHYSVIDMTLQGGLGDVVPMMMNIPVPQGDSAVDQLTGVRHNNNKDVWIVVRKHSPQSKYLAYLVTSTGISFTPVVSPSNLPTHYAWIAGHQTIERGGDLKISQDGTKLVCSDSLTEICDFNALTGVVTSKFTINVSRATGAEFSVDSRYLYLCRNGGNGNQNGYPGWQFDLSYTDSLSFLQHQILLGGGFGGKMQLAPNWKIYTGANPLIDSLNCINNPSLPGQGCNYQRDAVSLAGNNNNQCLVQFLQRYKAYIHFSGICYPDITHFTSDIWPPPDSIHWNFGDPASGIANSSILPDPSHSFTNIGTYTIELFVRHIDNRTDTSWLTITIYPKPQPNLGADQTICNGDSVTFDAGACTGCTYLWKDLGSGLTVGTVQTFRTGQAGTYAVIVMATSPNNCIGTDTVQLTTTAVPSVTNNPLSKTICSGESTNIALTSSVPGTNFHWTASLTSGNITGFSADSGLVITQVLSNPLPTPGIVTYQITPNVGSCAGTPVDFQVTVNPGDSVKVTIIASANNICAGTSVTFTANPTNPGATPVYQWKVNGNTSGTNSIVFTYTPLNGDVVTCLLTSSLTSCISNNPALSNPILMVINSVLIVNISINPSSNPVCAGSSVTFTATPINGGTTPFFQWKVNGINTGTDSPNFSYFPVNGDLVTCILTSSEQCTSNNPASSIQYPVSVNPLLPVSITISPSANPFCVGNPVTFTAIPTNGGTSPSYQWKVNGINVGSNNTVYTYIPVSGDFVLCILTSNIACPTGNPATSNTITMIQNNNLLAGVSIVASSNPFCPGNSVTFTATPSNGGTNPSYQWKVNGVNVGTNSSTYSYNPANGDSVRCIMTSNLSCVTGNPASSAKIIMSGTLAPIVTFTSCFDTITTVNAKPIKLKGGIPLGGTYSGPGVNSLTGIFTPATAGIGTKTITYTYTNVALCSVSKSISILNLPSSIFSCGNFLTDIRDNKIYPTIQIGSQCWLASNLNYGTILGSSQDQRDNCIAEKYCYNDNPTNCTNQGGLYQWDELMQYDETPADQGFCPPGWHIPSENDWNTLFANYINSGFAGSPLKYSGFSGFNALLSGARHINKSWDFQGFAMSFWSSTSRSSTQAWAHGMNEDDPSVSVYSSSRVNAFSVRCLKD